MTEHETKLIADEGTLIGQMRNHIETCVNDTKEKGIMWSFIDKEWAMYEFLAMFAANMPVNDAKTLVKYVMEGENE